MSTSTTHEFRAVLAAMTQAWNAGDATAYAAQFTPEASYVTFQGDLLQGRDAIRDVHRLLFDGPLRGTRLEPAAEGDTSVAFLRDDVAVVVSGGGARMPGQEGLGDRESVQTTVLVREDGRWLAAAFQNTRKQDDR